MSLKEQRKKKGMTLHELADKSGVHYIKIHQIESGKIKAENMILKNGLKLSDALDCHPKELLDKWPLDEDSSKHR